MPRDFLDIDILSRAQGSLLASSQETPLAAWSSFGFRMTSGGNTRTVSGNLPTEALGTRSPANRPTIPRWRCCWPACWRSMAGTIPRKPGKRISALTESVYIHTCKEIFRNGHSTDIQHH